MERCFPSVGRCRILCCPYLQGRRRGASTDRYQRTALWSHRHADVAQPAGLQRIAQSRRETRLSGYLPHKWVKAGAKVAAAQIAEGHGIDQYIAGLTHLISPPGTFSPAGEWLSKGSFFDITSTETRFRFCRNGRFSLINDIKFLDLARQRTNDSGNWEYQPPHLRMTVPGVARMTYLLTAGDGSQRIEWRRLKMEPDPTSVGSSTTAEQRNAANVGAKMMELVLKRMEGKTVVWTRTPPSLLPAESTSQP